MNVKLKPVSELQCFDLSNKEVLKTLKQTDIETKGKCFLSETLIPKLEHEKFRYDCQKFYKVSTFYL